MKKIISTALLLCYLIIPESVLARVRVHGLFTSNMVIQRETMAPVWGLANPGEHVSIAASWGSQAETTADAEGKWLAKIETPAAGGPYVITISGENEIILSNVLAGDVWVCGGQSNMDFPMMSFVKNNNIPEDISVKYSKAIAGKYSGIRTIILEKQYRAMPQSDIVVIPSFNNSWQSNTDSVINGQTTAVGFFFGRGLNEHLGIPIGLVDANRGGTSINLWISPEAMGNSEIPVEIDGVAKGNSVLYNGMIAPIMPFAIKGVIWYQGEANSKSMGSATAYADEFQTMIMDWRNHWGQGDIPFLFVQLASFHTAVNEPVSEQHFWPYTRESQDKALELPNTGMASAIDLGLQNNIHPWMKEELGERLVLVARKIAYNEDIVCSGPSYKKMKIKKNRVIVQFDHVGSGLITRTVMLDGIHLHEEKLDGFILCGADGEFHFASAKIRGETVELSCPEVREPAAVRYGWADFPLCNLYNREGLPANPFRTDK